MGTSLVGNSLDIGNGLGIGTYLGMSTCLLIGIVNVAPEEMQRCTFKV